MNKHERDSLGRVIPGSNNSRTIHFNEHALIDQKEKVKQCISLNS